MITFGMKVLTPFNDIATGRLLRIGETLEVDSEARARNIINQGFGELIYAKHDGKKGKRVLIHAPLLYTIGGIETANRQLAKAFPDHDITFVFEQADQTQFLETAKTSSAILDDKLRRYEADVLILTSYNDNPDILRRVNAEKVYQLIHTDWQAYKKVFNVSWRPHKRIDKFIAVSEAAQIGLKNALGVDSIVCRNVLNPIDEAERRMVFLVLSRATREKGIDRLIEFARRLDMAGKDYVIFLCSTIDDQLNQSEKSLLTGNKRILTIQPSPYSQELLRSADYLVQLSKVESYCYSVREALQLGVPVITSDLPAFREIIKDGKNGYILNDDLSNLDVERIFNKIPKPKPYAEEIDPTWEKVLNGEL